jgi:hypothetical protein
MDQDDQLNEYSGDSYGEYEEQSYVYHESVIQDDTTVFTDVKSKRRRHDDYLNVDPGHKVIGKKQDKLEYYATTLITGLPIRNAVTGIWENNLRVGFYNAEDQFFRVRYAGNESTNILDTLYYDTPEQFERHMHCTVDQRTKEAWQRNYEHATRPRETY